MMGHLGFSYIGAIWLAMLFIPNMLWVKRQPEGYTPTAENKTLVLLERIGQVCVTCIALVFSDFNLANAGWWSLWLIASLLMMLVYEGCWVRYFRNPTLAAFYGRLWLIPVPLATLPVAAFFLLGIYGRVIWMLPAVAVLGVGHIGIHLQHAKEPKQSYNESSN